jgi:hypothetical protein
MRRIGAASSVPGAEADSLRGLWQLGHGNREDALPYSVYVIELRRDVLEKKKVAGENPDRRSWLESGAGVALGRVRHMAYSVLA